MPGEEKIECLKSKNPCCPSQMVNNDAAPVTSVLVLNVVPKCTSAEPQIYVNRVQFRLQSAFCCCGGITVLFVGLCICWSQ